MNCGASARSTRVRAADLTYALQRRNLTKYRPEIGTWKYRPNHNFHVGLMVAFLPLIGFVMLFGFTGAKLAMCRKALGALAAETRA